MSLFSTIGTIFAETSILGAGALLALATMVFVVVITISKDREMWLVGGSSLMYIVGIMLATDPYGRYFGVYMIFLGTIMNVMAYYKSFKFTRTSKVNIGHIMLLTLFMNVSLGMTAGFMAGYNEVGTTTGLESAVARSINETNGTIGQMDLSIEESGLMSGAGMEPDSSDPLTFIYNVGGWIGIISDGIKIATTGSLIMTGLLIQKAQGTMNGMLILLMAMGINMHMFALAYHVVMVVTGNRGK